MFMEILAIKNEKKFQLFLESPNSLYLPRFYGQDKFGIPFNNKLKKVQILI